MSKATLNEVVSVLNFYAEGKQDGGKRARGVLRTLTSVKSAPRDESDQVLGALSLLRKALARAGASANLGTGAYGVMRDQIRKRGYEETQNVLQQILREWAKNKRGKLTGESLIDALRREP